MLPVGRFRCDADLSNYFGDGDVQREYDGAGSSFDLSADSEEWMGGSGNRSGISCVVPLRDSGASAELAADAGRAGADDGTGRAGGLRQLEHELRWRGEQRSGHNGRYLHVYGAGDWKPVGNTCCLDDVLGDGELTNQAFLKRRAWRFTGEKAWLRSCLFTWPKDQFRRRNAKGYGVGHAPSLLARWGGWLLRELVEVQVEAEDVDAGLTENA